MPPSRHQQHSKVQQRSQLETPRLHFEASQHLDINPMILKVRLARCLTPSDIRAKKRQVRSRRIAKRGNVAPRIDDGPRRVSESSPRSAKGNHRRVLARRAQATANCSCERARAATPPLYIGSKGRISTAPPPLGRPMGDVAGNDAMTCDVSMMRPWMADPWDFLARKGEELSERSRLAGFLASQALMPLD